VSKKDPTEIRVIEISTVRIHHGEPHICIFWNGPKGGSRGLMRLDRAEADKLLRALARACAALEEAATAAIVADGFRNRSKASKARPRKRRPKKLAEDDEARKPPPVKLWQAGNGEGD
jgi:hypothetical protein